ncbi:MAG: T9SS type A sorting domain-containing protein [candidate division Zixibacteria bacterium]|nr:T9SS type A sorting domain-containing protein [candidate division Zixibacteria bacterium]
MKRSLLAILLLLLACSFAFGQITDYVKWNTPVKYNEGQAGDVALLVTFQCAAPVGNVKGVSLGFALTATGAANFTYVTYTKHHDTDWFDLGGLLVDVSLMPNAFLMGGAALGAGMPRVTDEPLLTVDLMFGVGVGQICIDSAFFPPAGAWKFSNTTCDPVGGPRPYFVDAAGSDVAHPICVDVLEVTCVDPTIDPIVGGVLTGNHCNGLSHTFTGDPGNLDGVPATPVVWTVTNGPGSFAGAVYSAPAATTGTYAVEVTATNSCLGTATYNFNLVFTNQAPSILPATTPAQIGQGGLYSVDFDATDPNSCDPQLWSVVITPAPAGAYSIDGTGVLNWQTVDPDDGGITFQVCVTVDDGEPDKATATHCFDVEVLTLVPFEIQLEKVEGQLQGHYASVSIFLNKGTETFGGFDFLVAYDASALTFMGATLGAQLNAKWEYFTYRFGWNGNCDGACPSGMLRVVGIADINNGPNHPDPAWLVKQNPDGVPDELVVLTFYVTNDRTFECMYVPVRFFWHDCGDNAISSPMGDILYISRYVYDYDWTLGYRDITGTIHYGGHWWLFGPPYPFVDFIENTACMNPDPEKPDPLRFIDFIQGGVDIICSEDIDARGDLNMNEVANEIADAVLYTNYFIYGLSVFTYTEGSIAASDVNADGRVLTVGDLVYLVRIITGDALPYPKLSPFANSVTIEQGSVVTTNSQSDIGAALFVFSGEGEANLLVDGMKMESSVVDGQLRVLVWSDGTNHVPAGEQNLISVTGDLTIVEAEVSDYYGNLMNSTVVEKVIPTAFALNQNYPNPFNPSTDITINLPTQSSWKLDIYNVAGQLVRTFSGNAIGEVTVTWDAAGAASGIYFYKATAGQYTDTKKMVLMK